MKYWVVTTEGDPDGLLFSRMADLRGYLRAHPDVQNACRYWWYHDDLVDATDYGREDILTKTVRELEAGQTVRWAATH